MLLMQKFSAMVAHVDLTQKSSKSIEIRIAGADGIFLVSPFRILEGRLGRPFRPGFSFEFFFSGRFFGKALVYKYIYLYIYIYVYIYI